MNEIQIFDVEGAGIRFGTTEDGAPYAVASDFAKTMGYRDAANALRLLDEVERGTQIVSTPGGDQRVSVLYEDGMWELIFRSTLPGAKAIKARVKAILREIRETGRYEVAPEKPMTELEMAQRYVAALEREKELQGRVAELEPPAQSWQVLASGEGDYAVADAAKFLSREPSINVGRDKLFALLDEMRWAFRSKADNRWRAYQEVVNKGWLSELPTSYRHPHTGELALGAPQVRVTVDGLAELRRLLTRVNEPAA